MEEVKYHNNSDVGNKPEIRCCKCLVTLERLKRDGICSRLLVVARADGGQEYLCNICFGTGVL